MSESLHTSPVAPPVPINWEDLRNTSRSLSQTPFVLIDYDALKLSHSSTVDWLVQFPNSDNNLTNSSWTNGDVQRNVFSPCAYAAFSPAAGNADSGGLLTVNNRYGEMSTLSKSLLRRIADEANCKSGRRVRYLWLEELCLPFQPQTADTNARRKERALIVHAVFKHAALCLIVPGDLSSSKLAPLDRQTPYLHDPWVWLHLAAIRDPATAWVVHCWDDDDRHLLVLSKLVKVLKGALTTDPQSEKEWISSNVRILGGAFTPSETPGTLVRTDEYYRLGAIGVFFSSLPDLEPSVRHKALWDGLCMCAYKADFRQDFVHICNAIFGSITSAVYPTAPTTPAVSANGARGQRQPRWQKLEASMEEKCQLVKLMLQKFNGNPFWLPLANESPRNCEFALFPVLMGGDERGYTTLQDRRPGRPWMPLGVRSMSRVAYPERIPSEEERRPQAQLVQFRVGNNAEVLTAFSIDSLARRVDRSESQDATGEHDTDGLYDTTGTKWVYAPQLPNGGSHATSAPSNTMWLVYLGSTGWTFEGCLHTAWLLKKRYDGRFVVEGKFELASRPRKVWEDWEEMNFQVLLQI